MDFMQMPEEMRQQIEEQHRRYHMSVQMHRHSIKNFLNELDKEQLEVLDNLIGGCAGDKETASFYQGQIAQIRLVKFGVCLCGDPNCSPDELLAEEPVEKEEAQVVAKPTPPVVVDVEADDEQNMVKWGIERNPFYGKPNTEAASPHAPFRCVNCHMGYQSVQDRMLRKPGPDGCNGCQHKAKWG